MTVETQKIFQLLLWLWSLAGVQGLPMYSLPYVSNVLTRSVTQVKPNPWYLLVIEILKGLTGVVVYSENSINLIDQRI